MTNNYKVNITKNITINNTDGSTIILEEGDDLQIDKTDNFDEVLKGLTSFDLLHEDLLGERLYVNEINPPTGHGAHYPLEVQNDDGDLYDIIRHFNFINGIYKFTKLQEQDNES